METKFDVFKKTFKRFNVQDLILCTLYLTVFMAIGIMFKKDVIAYPGGMLSWIFDGLGTEEKPYAIYTATFLILFCVNLWNGIRFVSNLKSTFKQDRYYDDDIDIVESIGSVIAFFVGVTINLILFSFYAPIYTAIFLVILCLWSAYNSAR